MHTAAAHKPDYWLLLSITVLGLVTWGLFALALPYTFPRSFSFITSAIRAERSADFADRAERPVAPQRPIRPAEVIRISSSQP